MPTITLDGYGTFDGFYYSTDGGDFDYYAAPTTLTLTLSDDHIAVLTDQGIATLGGSLTGIDADIGGYANQNYTFSDMLSDVTITNGVELTVDWSIRRVTHSEGVTDVLELFVRDDLLASVDQEIFYYWFPLAGPDLPMVSFSEIHFDDPSAFLREDVPDGPFADPDGFSFFEVLADTYPAPIFIPGQVFAAGDDGGFFVADSGSDTLSGGAGDDSLFGRGGSDVITGGGGNDNLAGAGGNDTIDGGAGDDTIGGGLGDDTILGGAGNDLVGGGEGNDTIIGDASDDVGNDTISAGAGDDLIISRGGNDLVSGSAGNDKIGAGSGDDTIGGGYGDDSVEAGSGNDQVFAGTGADTVWGSLGDDLLAGGYGRDVLIDGSGADTLRGGPGDDLLGGAEIIAAPGDGDADVFQFNASQLNGSDTIVGFDLDLDVIEISNLDDASKITVTSQAGQRLSFEFIQTSVELVGLMTEDFDSLIFDLV